MTEAQGLPPGEWVTHQYGIRRFQPHPIAIPRHPPNTDKLQLLQERTILDILLATRMREREALTELLRLVSRKNSRKAA